jgi:hypothetical protein
MGKEQDVFILAQESLLNVVNQIAEDQWGLDVPAYMTYGGKKATLRDLVNYHAYDDAWVPDVLAGKTAEEVGSKYDGDLLGADPKDSYANYNSTATEAVRTFADLDKIVHLSYGDFPAGEYLKHITSFRGFRAYTIAHFIGVDTTLFAGLVDGLWDEIMPNIEEWRSMGVFGPAVDVPKGADKQTQLLALTGFLQK